MPAGASSGYSSRREYNRLSDIRLSVFTVAAPDLSPRELAAAAAKAGLDGIEWRYADVPPENRQDTPSFWGNNRCSISTDWDEPRLAEFRDAAASAGMTSLAVVPYLRCGDLEGTEKVLQAAGYLGAKMIRLGVHRYDRTRPFGVLFEEQRTYLRQAGERCKEHGVKGLVEIHMGTIAPSSSSAYRLVEGLDPDAIGVLLDPGNMVYEGYENYKMGMEILGPYLAHVHVKNAVWSSAEPNPSGGFARWSAGWSELKRGIVDWPQVIADLKAVGYRGHIGVEDFSGQFGTVDMLRHFAETMRQLLD